MGDLPSSEILLKNVALKNDYVQSFNTTSDETIISRK